MAATETLDIDDTVKALGTGMKTFLVQVLVGQGVIKCPMLANPFLNHIAYDLAGWAVDVVMGKGGMLAFVVNNKIINLDKRDDFVEAVTKIDQLPDDVDDHTWEQAEREASLAFKNLVGLAS